MPIYWKLLRLYSGRVALEHGLLVEILRSTENFWDLYTDLLTMNGKRESSVKELRDVMHKMGLVPKEDLKPTEEKKRRLLIKVNAEFSASLKRIEDMLSNLRMIVLDDETLMYRTLEELRGVYMTLGNIRHPPDYMLDSMLQGFYSLMHNMALAQEHAWNVSKAHSRGFMKVGEMTIISSRGERRRIRSQTIELNHIRNRIEPLREWVEKLRIVTSHEDIHLLNERITDLLALYTEELEDLKHILHEGDVLIHRTENLFKEIEHEAKQLHDRGIEKKIHEYSGKFHKLLVGIEAQARRETFDMDYIVKRLPTPESFHKERKDAEVISMEHYRKQHEQLKRAA
jgi:hypothetical protein